MSLHIDTPAEREALRGRLATLWEETGDEAIGRLARGRPPHDAATVDNHQDWQDWVSTCLMDCYKHTGDGKVFALLFELNSASFMQAIQGRLRRSHYQIDAHDVLQEVFLNIYRYPHRFLPDRPDAFRGWGHRIARNTLLKFLKGQTRLACFRGLDEAVVQPEDMRQRRPDRAALESESAETVNCAYVLYLQLYLMHFQRLSPRERYALTMVEVDGVSYRDAAAALGIRLENLKMVIFRGRRKIYRGMEQSLEGLRQHGVAEAARRRAPDARASHAAAPATRSNAIATPSASPRFPPSRGTVLRRGREAAGQMSRNRLI